MASDLGARHEIIRAGRRGDVAVDITQVESIRALYHKLGRLHAGRLRRKQRALRVAVGDDAGAVGGWHQQQAYGSGQWLRLASIDVAQTGQQAYQVHWIYLGGDKKPQPALRLLNSGCSAFRRENWRQQAPHMAEHVGPSTQSEAF